MCVCVRVCVCVCMCVCSRVCVFVCECVEVCVEKYTFECIAYVFQPRRMVGNLDPRNAGLMFKKPGHVSFQLACVVGGAARQ
jgi:hypothetical protein